MAKVAVILSGCGVFDGSEIHEAVITLLALSRGGAEYTCFAPNIDMMHVVNHLTGEVSDEKRNVLVESARIARGEVKDIKELNADDFDALVLPGGFGAAKNLTSFAIDGANCQINGDVKTACLAFATAQKPAAYLCIAPAIIPMIYPNQTQATIGSDVDTANALTELGATHQNCDVTDFVYDEQANVFSTPAYMLATNIAQAATGIEKTISALLGRLN